MPDRRGRDALENFARRARDLPALTSLDAAAVEALEAFRAAGVDALLLKGPALARMLYREGEHRGYSDVDLLVPPEALPGARNALGELGYVNVMEGLGIDEEAGGLDAETWAAAATAIDLHWRLVGAAAPPEIAWDALTRRRTEIDLAGRPVPVLNREGLAMQVATHAAQHGTAYAKPIEDLHKALERWSRDVWRRAERLAGEVEAVPAFAAGLRLVPAGAALADELGLPATDDVHWQLAHRAERPRGTFHLEAFADAPTLAKRAAVLRRSLFPKREWMAWQYEWAREGGVRLVVAYGLHLMRAPLWAARAWRFRRRARRAE